MATSQMNGVIQNLRRNLLLRDGAGLTDGQLLTDYISRRDEAALAALVQRHGPMVWGVCRRVLGNHHDAEDAFQATFLVLVRKAASIASRELLANWIYGVAHKTAMKARATIAKRRVRERQVTDMPEPAVAGQELWDDLQPLLDQELSRLPEHYRAVIVLCDLEGKTRREASRQLGVAEGTVASRLARARVMLAKRLAQQGVVVSGGTLAAMVSQNVASAGVPALVLSKTIKSASLLATGQAAATGLISIKVAILTDGVLRTMFLMKLKTATTGLLMIALVCGTAGTIYQTQAAEQPKGEQKHETNRDVSTSQVVAPPIAAQAVIPPKAAAQREYVLVSKLMEAGADQPKELLRLPKLTVVDGQLGNVHITDGPQNALEKVGLDEKVKIGTFFDVRVKRLEGNKVRLFCSLQRNEVEKSSDSEISVLGNNVQVIRDVELHNSVKVILQKDAKGSAQRWVEIKVDEQTIPAAGASLEEKEKAKEANDKKENKDKKDALYVDVVIDEVDFSANAITARATIHVMPPHDNVGGRVLMLGTTDSIEMYVTKFVRLPVMPEANLKDKKPKAGQRAILRLEMSQQGSLVVVGIEEFTGLERIGVNWLDAPGRKR